MRPASRIAAPLLVAAALLAGTSLAGGPLGSASFAGAEEEFRQGLSAYTTGDFATAWKVWGALAERSDPRAEAGIGFMYYRGLGKGNDDAQAAYWLQRAAEHGQAEGQYLLGTLYFFGKGVPQSYVQAYAWCDVAQNSGQADASFCRDAALQAMHTNADMQEAMKLGSDLQHRFGQGSH